MKNGLAAWHYPHRSVIENIDFFAGKGFDSISFNGASIAKTLAERGEEAADHFRRSGMILTLHYALPGAPEPEKEEPFREGIRIFGEWQRKYGLIENLTFDVSDRVRGCMTQYVDFVFDEVPNCKVGLEDYGLTEMELEQAARYKGNDRFGYLIDIGHLYIRLRGECDSKATLFTHSAFEGPKTDRPDSAAFLNAFKSKTFPIIEMHLHNNDGVKDTHLFLEDGTADVKAIAKAICDFGYEGIVTIESAPGYCFACYGDDADSGILRTLDTWKKAVSAVGKDR